MESRFSISQACLSKDRPPISSKVREYFELFLTEKLLAEKRVIVGGKWNVNLGLHFLEEGARYSSKQIVLGKGATIVSSESKKLYTIVIPLKVIAESGRPYMTTIELMWEALKIFFTATYKKITPEFMDELWTQVDLNYLLSLPYPASLLEQKYVGDKVNADGSVTIEEFSI